MGTQTIDSKELFVDPEGPIEHLAWGAFVICGTVHGDSEEGRIGAGKDIRVIGTSVTRWKEREGHKLKKSMITGVYDDDLEVLIIGTGVNGAIEVPGKVVKEIERHGIECVVVEPTAQACETFNELSREGRHVGLLAHGTC